jgi:hypothetical protein
MKKKNAESERFTASFTTMPPENSRIRSSERSTSGVRARCSTRVNHVSTATPTISTRIVCGESSSHSGPSIMASDTNVSPATSSSAPRTSTSGPVSSRLSTLCAAIASASVTAEIAAEIQKIQRHERSAVTIPPAAGPMPLSAADDAAHADMILMRSTPDHVAVSNASDAGVSAADPIPSRPIARISAIDPGASAAATLPATQITTPTRKKRARPNRSASRPPTMRNAQ